LPGGMQGIVSAMIVAQRTVGSTQVKGMQRLVGGLIGGTLGILVASVLIPGVSSLGVFGLLIAPILFCAAWLNDGSARYGYVAFQPTFAFILTLASGSGPEPNPLAPVDRFCGILIGIATASIIMNAIAPIDAWAAALRGLGRLLSASGSALAGAAPPGAAPARTALRDQTAAFLAELSPGATRRGWPHWRLEELLALSSRLSALAAVRGGAACGAALAAAGAHLSAAAQRLGDGVGRRRPARADDELARAGAELDR